MCIGSQNALREALYKTLAFCEQPRDFTEVEDFIAATDEFVYSHIMQTPFTMIGMLTDAGGLSQTPLDEAGRPLDAAVVRAAATMADAAFANRRKTLANSCKTYFAGKGEGDMRVAAALPHLFEQASVDPRLRGEALQTADFVRLGKALVDLGG